MRSNGRLGGKRGDVFPVHDAVDDILQILQLPLAQRFRILDLPVDRADWVSHLRWSAAQAWRVTIQRVPVRVHGDHAGGIVGRSAIRRMTTVTLSRGLMLLLLLLNPNALVVVRRQAGRHVLRNDGLGIIRSWRDHPRRHIRCQIVRQGGRSAALVVVHLGLARRSAVDVIGLAVGAGAGLVVAAVASAVAIARCGEGLVALLVGTVRPQHGKEQERECKTGNDDGDDDDQFQVVVLAVIIVVVGVSVLVSVVAVSASCRSDEGAHVDDCLAQAGVARRRLQHGKQPGILQKCGTLDDLHDFGVNGVGIVVAVPQRGSRERRHEELGLGIGLILQRPPVGDLEPVQGDRLELHLLRRHLVLGLGLEAVVHPVAHDVAEGDGVDLVALRGDGELYVEGDERSQRGAARRLVLQSAQVVGGPRRGCRLGGNCASAAREQRDGGGRGRSHHPVRDLHLDCACACAWLCKDYECGFEQGCNGLCGLPFSLYDRYNTIRYVLDWVRNFVSVVGLVTRCPDLLEGVNLGVSGSCHAAAHNDARRLSECLV
mmetsp:Transcript_9315/g.26598  ORF Transcript_9315/g.26598 Transcript_9315/m.26598 type:complete len:544 (+) Transcript_9315:260-1891(+)